jgi:hypothetical protein
VVLCGECIGFQLPGENKQQAGAWNFQHPTIVGINESMNDIHREVIQERFMNDQSGLPR